MADETKKPDVTKTPDAKVEKKPESKLKAVEKPAEGTEVRMSRLDTNGGKTDNYMWIEGTGESKHLTKGKKVEVNKTHGQHLIEKGAAKATTAPAKPQPKPTGKKKNEEDEEDD